MMIRRLNQIHSRLRACQKCPNVCGRAVHGPAMETKVMLIGQAPGAHEGRLGKPFAFTAGKTLFKWLESATGNNEEELREQIYFSAIARCFPGKAKSGQGDRLPDSSEIENCQEFVRDEISAIKPDVILAVGKLAISQLLSGHPEYKNSQLTELVGKKIRTNLFGHEALVIPLPHPSGVSRWPHTEIGKKKLSQAMKLIGSEFRKHAA